MNTLINFLKLFGIDCSTAGDSSFFGFPAWYRGIGGSDGVKTDSGLESCTIYPDSLEDIWIIAVNVIEILSKLAVYVAIGFIIYGGIMFVMSQGTPDKIAAAKNTLLYAVIGLVVSMVAIAITTYVAGALSA